MISFSAPLRGSRFWLQTGRKVSSLTQTHHVIVYIQCPWKLAEVKLKFPRSGSMWKDV